MASADRRGAARRVPRPMPRPIPLGLPLVAALLLTLLADRSLGLVSLAVSPQAGFVGGLLPDGPAGLLADIVAVAVVVLALVGLEISGRPRSRGATNAVLLVAALVGLQLGAVAAESATGVAVATDLYLARGLLLTGATVAAVFVLAALAEHRRTTAALRDATARAEALAISGTAALQDLRADVAGRVRAVLGEALTTLEAGGAPGSGARLRSLADEVLRPLSHRLAAMPAQVTPAERMVLAPRWRDTLLALMRTPVVPPRTLALLAAGLAFLRTLITDQELVRDLSPAIPQDAEGVGIALSVDAVPLLVVFAELALVFLGTRWAATRLVGLLERRRATLRPALAWLLVLSGLLGVAGLTVVGPAFVDRLAGMGARTSSVPLALGASFVPLLAVTLGVSLVAAVAAGRATLETRLEEQRAAAARAAARVQAVLGHEQRRLARSLHADVQATVNAAGLMLDRADREGSFTPELVDDVTDRIAVSVERFLGGGASRKPIVERLTDVRTLWAGVCRVLLEMDGATAARVDRDAVTRELLVDLVTEACANAVVHGRAEEVHVRIAVVADEVELTVSDDGTVRAAGGAAEGAAEEVQSRGGLGTEVLRASCTSFSLELGEGGGRLHAMVPLG